MAVLAFCPETARMLVIVTVARNTRRLDFNFIRILFVTVITCDTGMAATQRKVCIRVVIEAKFFPASRRMTFLAICPITALVHII